MLDAMVEVAELRALVSEVFKSLPSCTVCLSHLATHSNTKSTGEYLEELGRYRCSSCFEDLEPDERSEFTPLPWVTATEKLELFYKTWQALGLVSVDSESIVQVAFSFR